MTIKGMCGDAPKVDHEMEIPPCHYPPCPYLKSTSKLLTVLLGIFVLFASFMVGLAVHTLTYAETADKKINDTIEIQRSRVDAVVTNVAVLNSKFEAIDKKLESMNAKLDTVISKQKGY